MEPISLLVSSDKIKWGMPIEDLLLFTAEDQCSIPFEFLGSKEICRYVRSYNGVSLYVTPVFSHQHGLISLRGLFDFEDNAEEYHRFFNSISSGLGTPVYVLKEEEANNKFLKYPCYIWIVNEAIVEIGIREDNFVAFGYVVVTNKEHHKIVYTDKYLDLIGWDPKKSIH